MAWPDKLLQQFWDFLTGADGAPLPTIITISGEIDSENMIYQMVDTVGDGSGTYDMNTTAASFFVVPPANKVYDLARINIYIADNGTFNENTYGGASALSNGIQVTVENAAGVVKLLTPDPIKRTFEWGLQSGVDVAWSDFAANNNVALVRWTFNKAGSPIHLDGSKGEFLRFNVRDSLATLIRHKAQVQGIIHFA